MTADVMKTLELARKAVAAGDGSKEASVYYEQVHKEMPENLEAEWFYIFYKLTAGIDKDTANNYERLCKITYPTLKLVATIENEGIKQSLAVTIVKTVLPLGDALWKKMFDLRGYGHTEISLEDIAKISSQMWVEKEILANKILEDFGDSNPYCVWVADIWKEMIAERFKQCEYRNFQDKGKELWFDELAKKIKKYDPSYEMPQFKQAGCISTGDAANAPIGR